MLASLVGPVNNGPSYHHHRSLHSIAFPIVGSNPSSPSVDSSSPTSTATTTSLGSPQDSLLEAIQGAISSPPSQSLDSSSLSFKTSSPASPFPFDSSAPAPASRIELNGAYGRLPLRRRSDPSQDEEKSDGDVELAEDDRMSTDETNNRKSTTTSVDNATVPPSEGLLQLDEGTIVTTSLNDLGTTPSLTPIGGNGVGSSTPSSPLLISMAQSSMEDEGTNPAALFDQQEDLSRYLQSTGSAPTTSSEEVPNLSPASDSSNPGPEAPSTSKVSSSASPLTSSLSSLEDSGDEVEEEEISSKPKAPRRHKRRGSCPVPQPSSIKRPCISEKPHIILSVSTGSTGEATLAAGASLKQSPSPPLSSSSNSASGICAVDGCTMTSRKGRKLCHKHQKLRERGVELPALREGVSLGRSRKPYDCLGKTQKYERQLQAKEILSRILADPVAEQHVLMELWPNHTTESVIAKNARNFFHSLPASAPFRLQLLAALSEGLSDRSACSEFGVSLQALVRARHQRGDGPFGLPDEADGVPLSSAPISRPPVGDHSISRSPSPSKTSSSSKPSMSTSSSLSHLPPPPPQSMEPLGLFPPTHPLHPPSSYPHARSHTYSHPHSRASSPIPPPPSSAGQPYPVLNLGGFIPTMTPIASSTSTTPLSITPITMHISSMNPLPPLPPLPLAASSSPLINTPASVSSSSTFSSQFSSFTQTSKEAPSPPNIFSLNSGPGSPPMPPSFNHNHGGNGSSNILNVDFFSSYIPSSDSGGGRRNSLDFLSGGLGSLGASGLSGSFLAPNSSNGGSYSSAPGGGSSGGGLNVSPLPLSSLFSTPPSSQPSSASSSSSSLGLSETPTTERASISLLDSSRGAPSSTSISSTSASTGATMTNSMRISSTSATTSTSASNMDLESESWFGSTVDLSQLSTPLPGGGGGGAPPADGVVDESFVVPRRVR